MSKRGIVRVEGIVDAALCLIDEKGDFSIPEIAKLVGVSGAALYRHVTGRAEIIDLVRQRLLPEFIRPVEALNWQDALTSWMRGYRDVFSKHPNLVNLFVRQTVHDPKSMDNFDGLARILTEAGLEDRRILVWITALDSYALSIALFAVAPPQLWSPEKNAHPDMYRAVNAFIQPSRLADDTFSAGLKAFISAISMEVERK